MLPKKVEPGKEGILYDAFTLNGMHIARVIATNEETARELCEEEILSDPIREPFYELWILGGKQVRIGASA